MNVFHHHLETIKASCLWNLNLCHEPLSQVFENYAIRSSKEGQNHLDEMLFILIESGPILDILTEIDFFSCPEASHLLLVHPPDVIVLDWKYHESTRVLLEDRLFQTS